MNPRKGLGVAALIALFVLFVGLTVLANQLLRGTRIDLTASGLYTTAPGTQRILGSLKEPINLYFFYSERAASGYPAIQTYGTRVREFLQELANASDGKIRLSRIDPQAFSDEEDRAAEFGIKSVPTGNGTQPLYFGLAGTNSTDGRAMIEFFDPAKEQFLEYDVVKLIQQLGNSKKPVVGWLSSLPMDGGSDPRTGAAQEPWAVVTQTEQLFTLRRLELTVTSIDADIDVLTLVHPKNLSDGLQDAIKQYLRKGGKLLLFVDPLAEQDPTPPPASQEAMIPGAATDRASHAEGLLQNLGIEFDTQNVVGDAEHALVVSAGPNGVGTRHLGILGLDAGAFAQDEIITAGLSSINLASAGSLKARAGSPYQFTPLLQTGKQSALIPVARFAMLMDPATLRDGFRPTGERFTLAARITGTTQQPMNAIVVADTDLLSNYLWVREENFFGQRVAQAFANNGDLVWNALDNLAGSSDLISVRGRASFSRPFDTVESLRRAAEDRFRTKEKELEEQLQQTEDKLSALQAQRPDQAARELILTAEQQQELDSFQQRKTAIRRELRAVRLNLNQDIENLGKIVKILNIIVFPLVLVIALALVARLRRRRRHTRA
ncbi:MAG: Gldg family protein [Steroidobacteraceae bacterium]